MHADVVYYLHSKVRFTNPFYEEVGSDYFYSFVLVVWEPTPASTPPTLQPLELPRVESSDPAQLLRIRRCVRCGKYCVLPRYQAEPDAPFQCTALADSRFASCTAPCPVWFSDS